MCTELQRKVSLKPAVARYYAECVWHRNGYECVSMLPLLLGCMTPDYNPLNAARIAVDVIDCDQWQLVRLHSLCNKQ